jgi:hypothetical protein
VEPGSELVRAVAVGPVVMVRFMVPPTGEVADQVLRLTEKTRADTGDRLSFVGIVGHGLAMPSTEFRAKLAAQGGTIKGNAASIHFVIEGEGFLPRLQRGMIGAIAGVVAIGVPVQIHKDVAEALHAVERIRGIAFATLEAGARRAGLVFDPTSP